METHISVWTGARLWIFKCLAGNGAPARRSGFVAILIQPRGRDRPDRIRGAAVPDDRRPDPLRMAQTAAGGVNRNRIAGYVLVYPAGVLRIEKTGEIRSLPSLVSGAAEAAWEPCYLPS